MPNVYVNKINISQQNKSPKAMPVLDTSSQNKFLQCKADMANNAAQRAETPRPNNTGMPDNLKAGIESLSGFSMDDVRVHYNSSKPATVQALAYTQGTDIHVASGQEKHLPHEAWHVAQQMAGRVSPTTNINGMPVNDNAALEHEADVMGEKAAQCKEYDRLISTCCKVKKNVAQCKGQKDIEEKMGAQLGIKEEIEDYGGLCGGWSLLMLKNPEKAVEIWTAFENKSVADESDLEIFGDVIRDQLCLSQADEEDESEDDEFESAKVCLEQNFFGRREYDAGRTYKYFVDAPNDTLSVSDVLCSNPDMTKEEYKKEKVRLCIATKAFLIKQVFEMAKYGGKWILSTDDHYMSIAFDESCEKGIVSATNETGIVGFDNIESLVRILMKESKWYDSDSYAADGNLVFKCCKKQVDDTVWTSLSRI